MARPKKIRTAPIGAALDPMTAAILAGLKPHIDAAVTDKFTTLLVDMLAKIAPERLAKAADQARPATVDQAPTPANQRPESSESGASKGSNGAKKNPSPTAVVTSE